jgi:hypothetical protein
MTRERSLTCVSGVYVQEAVFGGMQHLVELPCLEQGRMLVYGLHRVSVCDVTDVVSKERTCRHI